MAPHCGFDLGQSSQINGRAFYAMCVELKSIKKGNLMANHMTQDDQTQDAKDMKSLFKMVVGFFLFTIALGITVGAIMG